MYFRLFWVPDMPLRLLRMQEHNILDGQDDKDELRFRDEVRRSDQFAAETRGFLRQTNKVRVRTVLELRPVLFHPLVGICEASYSCRLRSGKGCA